MNNLIKWNFTFPLLMARLTRVCGLGVINVGAAVTRSGGGRDGFCVQRERSNAQRPQRNPSELPALPEDDLHVSAKELQAPYELVIDIVTTGRPPVAPFIAGGASLPRRCCNYGCSSGADRHVLRFGHLQCANPSQGAGAVVKSDCK